MPSLFSGHILVAVLGAAPLVPHAKAGRVRLIAVTSKERAKALPDVPTLAEMGYPDMDISQWFGAMAPAALLRVFGGMALPSLHLPAAQVSGPLWTAAYGIFAARYCPIFTRSRLDGKPG
jgi:hypothetical protein